jgi:hypothetical protein
MFKARRSLLDNPSSALPDKAAAAGAWMRLAEELGLLVGRYLADEMARPKPPAPLPARPRQRARDARLRPEARNLRQPPS